MNVLRHLISSKQLFCRPFSGITLETTIQQRSIIDCTFFCTFSACGGTFTSSVDFPIYHYLCKYRRRYFKRHLIKTGRQLFSHTITRTPDNGRLPEPFWMVEYLYDCAYVSAEDIATETLIEEGEMQNRAVRTVRILFWISRECSTSYSEEVFQFMRSSVLRSSGYKDVSPPLTKC